MALGRANIQSVRPGMTMFGLSAKTGQGLQEFLAFIAARCAEWRRAAAAG